VQVVSEIAVTKRAARAAEAAVQRLEKEKQRQDFLIDGMQVGWRRRSCLALAGVVAAGRSCAPGLDSKSSKDSPLPGERQSPLQSQQQAGRYFSSIDRLSAVPAA
jgi:hypothetical protein